MQITASSEMCTSSQPPRRPDCVPQAVESRSLSMIRFLQRDNRLTKALFVVIIAAASVSMVVYLIPGLTNTGVGSADTYAEIYPHWYSRFLHAGETVTMQRVSQEVRNQIQQRGPQYADNPIIVNFFTQQVGQQLIQEQILMAEAARL